MRRAEHRDIPTLVSLMAEFYAESGFTLDLEMARKAFADILGDERLGYVWVIEAEGQDAGHMVVTVRYAMEYGGLIGCLDDLYVSPAWRNRGLSTAALAQVRHFCRNSGMRALTVEVGHDNGPARNVYRRAGFEEAADRVLLALPLAAPTHLA
jgi:GNAT superfamily N-acetyltransferase